ncbi:MAG: DUF4190 domain-containing protein [Ktedonobacterales bacterium]
MTNPEYDPYGGQQPSYPSSYPPPPVSPSMPLYPQSGQLPPQQQYGQQFYGQQPVYGQPMVMPMMTPVYMGPTTETSGWAIASLICSLLGASILGVIFGHISLNEIKKSAGRVTGQGMAMAGLIIGYIGLGFTVLCCAWYVFVIMLASSSAAVGQ